VLFADLVGFTTLSESRDSEEVRELLSRYFDASRQLIARYGGTVEKFIGDAVMAVWGTPVAREDDAERAVRAALDLVSAVSALGQGDTTPFQRAQRARFGARLARAEGVTESIEPGYKEAAGLFREIGTPFWLGETLLEHAEWLGGEGREGEAGPLFDEARGIFERLRARPWLERAERVAAAESVTT
jgi:Adenylate and Guanylate cyclase catalytic domain